MTVSSIFSQMLQLIPRPAFARIVANRQGERHARGFTCWGQTVAMLFCHLGQAKSLREISEGLQASEGRLRHLGLSEAPGHSTLAYANAHRPWEIYQDLFQFLLTYLQSQLGLQGKSARQFSLPGKLLSLDSTLIDLCAKMFDWAKYKQTKGAVKIHLLLDHDGCLPQFAVITDGKTSDIETARTLAFAPGTMLVMDRGYNDYEWFSRLGQQGVWFVTRLKEDASFVSLEKRSAEGDGVRGDEVISFTSHARQERDIYFRRITFWDAENEREFVFLTNHLELPAATIAELYRQRWQIEQFFRLLKQNLRVKTFVGTSANALKIQIWTALIALLLVKFLQLRSKFSWHLSRLMALLRQQIFVYRCLWRFLDHPLEPPPAQLVPLPLFDYLPDESGQQTTASNTQPQPCSPVSVALSPMPTALVPAPIS
jgi:IS4 transposase